MTHDYKNYAQPKPGPMPIPLWVWLFAIVSIGGFGGLLYYLDLYDKGQIGTNHEQNIRKILTDPGVLDSEAKKKTSATKKDSKAKDTGTSFDFYSILPSMEVIIPEREVAVKDHEVPKQTSPTSVVSYILQAGSFKDPKQAERLKAGLALIGIESTIEPVNIKKSGTFHRVRIGPFTNMREIDKVRSRMRDNNVEPILLRDKT